MKTEAAAASGKDGAPPVPAARPMVEVRDLAKRFSSAAGSIEVLRAVSFDLWPGQSLSIRGESGSGKSTLLNLVSGLESADAGTVRWEGRLLHGKRVGEERIEPVRGRFLGFVFQAYYLVPELHALDNVLLAGRIAGLEARAGTARARELLERVGLGGRWKQMPTQMSGGERQRVALARALLNRPRLLLADEPTGNLDERTGQAVMDVLLRMCAEEKTGLLLVTHNPEFARRTDRQSFLQNGVLEERTAEAGK